MPRGCANTPEAEAERRRKIGEFSRGRKMGTPSAETRAKIAATLKGRTTPPAVRETQRAAQLARREDARAKALAQWDRQRAANGQEAPGYFGLHLRVRKERGLAKSHPCCVCGMSAKDWAQTHGTDGRSVDDYRPMCRKCHFRYDEVGKRAKAALGPVGRREAALKAWETKRAKLVS